MRLIHGRAQAYTASADMVFTHPYGPLPSMLRSVPAIINLHTSGHDRKRSRAETWVHGVLSEIGRYAGNRVYVTRLPVRAVTLDDLAPVSFYAGGGCFPDELVRRLLLLYVDCLPSNGLIWDGFMGRGTVGKVARELGYRFVGIDARADRYRLACAYLGVT